MITCIIDGLDISQYIQYSDITESMRKVTGANSGTTLDGTYIEDLVAVKYDPTFKAKPMPPSILAQLNAIMAQEYVTMTYTSFLQNQDVTGQYVPQSVTATQKMYVGAPIIDGVTLSFIQR